MHVAKKGLFSIFKLNHSSFSKTINGQEYIFTPQILLRQNATHHDIFRALLITNRLVYNIQTIFSNHNSTNSSHVINPTDNRVLIQLIQEAYTIEQNYIVSVESLLQLCGWDLSKFMYGDIKTRVDWS
jgi:hypothetical protein